MFKSAWVSGFFFEKATPKTLQRDAGNLREGEPIFAYIHANLGHQAGASELRGDAHPGHARAPGQRRGLRGISIQSEPVRRRQWL